MTRKDIFYPAFDSLRGIAILFVVIYHCFSFVTFFRFGWLGVDLFFVLSGFLITDILLRSRKDKFFFRNFYIRRALRILPLYYFILTVYYLSAGYFFSEKNSLSTFSYYQDNKLWFWLYLQNWLLFKKEGAPVPYLTHLWSLAIEEQFYIVWPIVVFFIRKLAHLKYLIILLIVCSIALRIYISTQAPSLSKFYFYNSFARMDSLLFGCLLSVIKKQNLTIPSWLIRLVYMLCILVLALSLSVYGNLSHHNLIFFSIGYTTFGALFATVIYQSISLNTIVHKWLVNARILTLIGKVSYGIYIYHLPIYLVVSTKLYKILKSNLEVSTFTSITLGVISILCTLLVSSISYLLLEKPFLEVKKYFQN